MFLHNNNSQIVQNISFIYNKEHLKYQNNSRLLFKNDQLIKVFLNILGEKLEFEDVKINNQTIYSFKLNKYSSLDKKLILNAIDNDVIFNINHKDNVLELFFENHRMDLPFILQDNVININLNKKKFFEKFSDFWFGKNFLAITNENNQQMIFGNQYTVIKKITVCKTRFLAKPIVFIPTTIVCLSIFIFYFINQNQQIIENKYNQEQKQTITNRL